MMEMEQWRTQVEAELFPYTCMSRVELGTAGCKQDSSMELIIAMTWQGYMWEKSQNLC